VSVSSGQRRVFLRRFSVWRQPRWILTDLSAELYAGELCALVGPNGSGKSTLLRALAGVLQPPWQVSGELEIAFFERGAVFQGAVELEMRKVSWVAQSLTPTDEMTVREFIWLSLAHSNKGRTKSPEVFEALPVLERFGVGPLLDTLISDLSGGQWQRVRLACGLALRAGVFLLDEPDTYLDERWREVLWSVLADLCAQGACIIVALHRFDDLQTRVDRWWGLAGGQLMFSHQELGVYPGALLERLFLGKGLDSAKRVG